jgi:hypothetical protein
LETIPKEAVMETPPHEDKDKDGSTKEEIDPWNPPYPPCPPGPRVVDLNVHIKLANEWLEQKRAIYATSRATKIITPDRTPEVLCDGKPSDHNYTSLPSSTIPYDIVFV